MRDAGAGGAATPGEAAEQPELPRSPLPEPRSDAPDSGGGGGEGGAGPAPARPIGVVFPDAGAACSFPDTQQADSVLFSGALVDEECRLNLDAPYGAFWYAYQDSEGELAVSQRVESPGCDAQSCSLRALGPTAGALGFSVYGAGVGFTLAAGNIAFDASRFTGIQYWARGLVAGTRGPGATSSPQTMFMKLVSATNRLGDDFGMYCQIDTQDWTLCRQAFSDLGRDGYVAVPEPANDRLELESLTRIEFQFSLYRDPSGSAPTPVRFDIELASISFF